MPNRGNGRHAPTPSTRAVVRALAAFGINHEHIAAKLTCSVATLQRNYKKELAEASYDMLAKVAQSLYNRAIDPKGGMASEKAGEFLMKTRGGWRDNFQSIEHSGDAGPMGAGGSRVVLVLPVNPRDIPPPVERVRLAPPIIDGDIIEDDLVEVESEPNRGD
jgi:hypothetical protein